MIRIPQPIEYDELHHFGDIITKPLNPKLPSDLKFIQDVLADLKKADAEAYIVRLDTGKVKVCRKRLKPPVTAHKERNCFYALRNSAGKIMKPGKNSRRPEMIINAIKHIIRHNQVKFSKLKRSTNLTTVDRCKLFGYELLKQDEPF